MVALGCGNNLPGYYMYRGGVNQILGTTLQESKATGYPNDYPILNYDFQAPLGSWGQTHSAYRKLKLQHLFLQCFQKMFAPMETRFQEHPILDRRDKKSLRYCVRTDGAKGFVFVNLYQRLDQLEEKKSVRFEVPVREGTMVFPEKGMRIPSGTYCFLPYRIPMGEETLLYATAQLLWKEDDTWFFFAAPGIETEYCMENPKGKKSFYKVQAGKHILHLPGCRIVTLTQEEAENFYAIDGKIFLTEGAEMYREGDKLTVRREEKPDLSFFRWNGEEFIYESLLLEQRTKEIARISRKSGTARKSMERRTVFRREHGNPRLEP